MRERSKAGLPGSGCATAVGTIESPDVSKLVTVRAPTPAPQPRAPVWQAMLSGLIDPALILDINRTVLAANAVAESMLGAKPGYQVLHIIRFPEVLQAVDRAFATGQQQNCDLRMLFPIERHLSGLLTPLGGRMAGEPAMLLALRDLTAQQQLADMREEFVANASHELRTPLASLKGFLETISGPAKDDPVARGKFIAIMQEQADRMSRLIDDLLSLSRIEMREHVLPHGDVDVAEIADSIAKVMQPLANKDGRKLTVRVDARPAKIAGDRDELMQVIQNLVQNAIKYGRPDGRIDVTVGRQGPRIAIVVADDGIGIAPEHLPRLTERFYRVSAKESRERGGTGLGLAIVKHIINRHRGELKIESVQGSGSTFTVLLPADLPDFPEGSI